MKNNMIFIYAWLIFPLILFINTHTVYSECPKKKEYLQVIKFRILDLENTIYETGRFFPSGYPRRNVFIPGNKYETDCRELKAIPDIATLTSILNLNKSEVKLKSIEDATRFLFDICELCGSIIEILQVNISRSNNLWKSTIEVEVFLGENSERGLIYKKGSIRIEFTDNGKIQSFSVDQIIDGK